MRAAAGYRKIIDHRRTRLDQPFGRRRTVRADRRMQPMPMQQGGNLELVFHPRKKRPTAQEACIRRPLNAKGVYGFSGNIKIAANQPQCLRGHFLPGQRRCKQSCPRANQQSPA